MVSDHRYNGHDPDMFDVRAAVRNMVDATRQHRNVVLGTCLVVLVLVTWYAWVWPPIYRAEAMVMVEKDTDTQRDAFYVNWAIFRKDDARTEIELLTSAPVLREVVQREHLKYDDVYHPIMSQLTYFWEKSLVGRNYIALKKKLFPEKDALALSDEEKELSKTINDMGAGITVETAGESNVGRLKVKGPSRKVAQIANALLDVYLKERSQRYQSEAQRAYDFLTQEMNVAGKELKAVEDRRVAYSRKHDLVFDLTKENVQVKQLTELQADIVKSKTRIASIEASLRAIEAQLRSEPPTKPIQTIEQLNTLRETAKMKRLELETALVHVRDHYREDSPEVTTLKGDIVKLDQVIASQPEKVLQGQTSGLNAVHEQLVSNRDQLLADLDGTRAGLKVMEETEANLNAHLSGVPEMDNELHGMDRDKLLATEKFQAVVLKRAQAGVSLATTNLTMPSMRVVAYAVPPSSQWWPRMKILYPAALFAGLALGLVAAMVVRFASGKISRSDLEQGHRTVPLYGTVVVGMRDRPMAVVSRGNGVSEN